jgi:hypothetical protein
VEFRADARRYLSGLPYEKLLRALQSVNVHPLESPMADHEF